jgi:DNA-binding NarL/FixJ family response regulator
MKTEGDRPRPGISPQFQGQDGILLASDVLQTRTSVSMPVPIQRAGISVSIVEDAPHTGQVLSDWIRLAEGFSLVNYHNTVDGALAALPNEKPAIVLIDINLPSSDASSCIRQLKPSLQQTQFVVLTVNENTDEIFNALTSGATGYLLAQTSRAELLAAVKHIHAGGSPMSRVIAKKVLQSFQIQPAVSAAAELSPRENRILRLLANGSSYQEAAELLNISLPMIGTYIRSIYEKLHLHSAARV